MTIDDIKARIGGTIKRRHTSEWTWKEVEVKNEDYAAYYFDLTKHGYEYQL